MNNDVIRHAGVVKAIDGQHVRVTILQATACGGCAARAMCSSAEAKEKEVDVTDDKAGTLAVGQAVWLEGRMADSRTAAIVAYGVPLLVMVAVLAATVGATGSEPLAAVLALASVAAYYAIVRLFFRQRLQRTFSFAIRHGEPPRAEA
ncbi:MAG: SoxR reducing system RseC family protein [Bacteroidaceae bacterium]|nr:SoxR reducing system RseC family protein [Bacteroidaceae bacterium]